ncbi:uncharacterized protein [Rutidosis leptorrhynchoides]|uniref:uncharacterized protein n=1 Tax=Rutidosis leptorrhynchoides TaxID=125765 RepID=UPI003A99BDF0
MGGFSGRHVCLTLLIVPGLLTMERSSTYVTRTDAPASVLKLLESLRCNFFWGGSGSERKLSWVKWDKVLLPYGAGGLNIGSLVAKNLALLGKWWWRFKAKPNALWVKIISSIYGPGGGLGDANNFSFSCGGSTWTNIIKAGISIFSTSIIKEIGDGSSINFWLDSWTGTAALQSVFSRLYALETDKYVKVRDRVINTDGVITGQWHWTRELRGRALCDLDELTKLIERVHFQPNSQDNWKWLLSSDGIFTAKVLSGLIDEKWLPNSYNAHVISRNNVVHQKVWIYAWKAIQKRLPVRVEIDKRDIDLDSLLCPICGDEVETVEHSISTCKKVAVV